MAGGTVVKTTGAGVVVVAGVEVTGDLVGDGVDVGVSDGVGVTGVELLKTPCVYATITAMMHDIMITANPPPINKALLGIVLLQWHQKK